MKIWSPFCGRDQAVRLRPDLDPLDHPVRRGIDDVDVVARGVGHVELLDRLLRARGRPQRRETNTAVSMAKMCMVV